MARKRKAAPTKFHWRLEPNGKPAKFVLPNGHFLKVWRHKRKVYVGWNEPGVVRVERNE